MEHTQLQLQGLATSITDLAHAYIIEGKDLAIRNSQALELGYRLLCQSRELQQPACGVCKSCLLIDSGSHPDLMLVGENGSSVGVDEVRAISTYLHKTSQLSGNQVVIIHNAELMTESASNALLKTLEEPTKNSYLLLLTNDKNQLLPTIISRCQFVTVVQKSKQQLKSAYPDLPDYVIGFSNQSESSIKRWLETNKIERFTEVYQLFVTWLKQQVPASMMQLEAQQDEETEAFLVYLLTRRIRQLMLKMKSDSAAKANRVLLDYNFARRQVKGQNKVLALAALLHEVEPLVR